MEVQKNSKYNSCNLFALLYFISFVMTCNDYCPIIIIIIFFINTNNKIIERT